MVVAESRKSLSGPVLWHLKQSAVEEIAFMSLLPLSQVNAGQKDRDRESLDSTHAF